MVSVVLSVLALWYSSPFPHLGQSNYYLGYSVNSEWSDMEHPNSSNYSPVYFPDETSGSPVKTSFSSTSPPAAATSPFGPCAEPSAVQSHHEPGWQEDANCSAASFPHWRPNGFAGMLQVQHKNEILGHCSPAIKSEAPDRKQGRYHLPSWDSISR